MADDEVIDLLTDEDGKAQRPSSQSDKLDKQLQKPIMEMHVDRNKGNMEGSSFVDNDRLKSLKKKKAYDHGKSLEKKEAHLVKQNKRLERKGSEYVRRMHATMIAQSPPTRKRKSQRSSGTKPAPNPKHRQPTPRAQPIDNWRLAVVEKALQSYELENRSLESHQLVLLVDVQPSHA